MKKFLCALVLMSASFGQEALATIDFENFPQQIDSSGCAKVPSKAGQQSLCVQLFVASSGSNECLEIEGSAAAFYELFLNDLANWDSSLAGEYAQYQDVVVNHHKYANDDYQICVAGGLDQSGLIEDMTWIYVFPYYNLQITKRTMTYED